jgi:phosphoglycolate phosphatase-like HAD superfamily hydrolase
MTRQIIHALDFDGVLCDSAVETGITGWKAATKIWDDMPGPLPPPKLVEAFRIARPAIETGYEAILAMRLLFSGVRSEALLGGFARMKDNMLEAFPCDIDALKRLFGETRDHWIREDRDEWIGMNPLFSGIAEQLGVLSAKADWYIITTKQERFVQQILNANRICLAEERIFGLDRSMSKEEVLAALFERHPGYRIRFVEDRLATLLKILRNGALQAIRLFLANWGYNTEADRCEAKRHAIELIDITHLLE